MVHRKHKKNHFRRRSDSACSVIRHETIYTALTLGKCESNGRD